MEVKRPGMITVKEAKQIIAENISALQPVTVGLNDVGNKILAEDVFAPMDMPSFPQSSMDGYAFAFDCWERDKSLKILGESAAGDDTKNVVKENNAVRIFTGAMVPAGADTVVMQEKTRLENDYLFIEDDVIGKGANVRLPGAEIKKGDLAMPKGSLITPATIGFLAGIGVREMKVYPNPRIGIVITGNELTKPGEQLLPGKIFDSNSFALTCALKNADQHNIQISYVKDEFEKVEEEISRLLSICDVVLLTGGVSVGDYDFVVEAATACGVTKLFHKIKQRPGKPLFFGMVEHKVVFGLPGNPSSVLTCFYEYVLPALEKLTLRRHRLSSLIVPIREDYEKKIPLTVFLKGYYDGNEVAVLGAQESFKMNSYARANCLIVLDEATQRVNKGGLVEIHLLY